LETVLKQELLDLSNAIDPGDPYSQTEVFLGQPSPVVFFGNDPAALIPLITHDPIELMAFLSAVHGAFSLADVESVIQDVFDQQYQLTVETNTISGIAVTTVTLIITPLIDVITDIMTDEQLELFELFMLTLGMGQIVASPFDFDWLPFLTSPFGFRIHPITGGKEMHLGIDIGRPTGTPLQAGVNGTVIFAGDMGGYGNVVMLLSADGIIEVRYAHMHDIFVSAGEEVSIGDIIGTVGSTGMSTGPHLHLEVLVNGVHLNPIVLVSPGP
jgi:murein DD-endopeptidase MepM/ murein hydrolase activator NlpD